MAVRRLPFASALGVAALMSSIAFADEAAPAPPASFVAPPPTVVVDASDPVCNDSRLSCQQLEPTQASPEEMLGQMKTVGPILRELRRCLNHESFTAVPATLRITWSATATTIEVARGLDTHPCILQAKQKVSATKSPTPVALSCTYECSGGILPTPVAPVPVPPPAPTPSPTPSTKPQPPTPPPAPAPAPAPEPPRQPPPEERPLATMPPPEVNESSSSSSSGWYGWQTLLADGASAGILTGGLLSWTVEPTVIGYSGFLLGTPIMHAIHGNYGRMLASFGLRLLLPAVSGAVGAALNVGANGEDTKVKGVVVSAGIGIGIAAAACVIIDAGFLAWDNKERRSGKNDTLTHLLQGTF